MMKNVNFFEWKNIWYLIDNVSIESFILILIGRLISEHSSNEQSFLWGKKLHWSQIGLKIWKSNRNASAFDFLVNLPR